MAQKRLQTCSYAAKFWKVTG